MKTPVYRRIVSAVMAAVVSAGMLSVQDLIAFAEQAAGSSKTQTSSVTADLTENLSAALEEESFEYAAEYKPWDYTYTVSNRKATIIDYFGSDTKAFY